MRSKKPELIDFKIEGPGPISNAFLQKDIHTFKNAADFVRHLPYKRNTDKYDSLILFKETCGTCSTKHAVLKALADENNYEGMELVLGIFKMNPKNTPPTGPVLERYGLTYIPEAHNYLKFRGQILDVTNPRAQPSDFIDDLLDEVVILPGQITDYKVSYHKQFLQNWLNENPDIPYTLPELWNIREQCIEALSR